MSRKIAILWFAVLLASLLLVIPGAMLVKNVRNRDTRVFRNEKIENWDISYENKVDDNGMYRICYTNVLTDIQNGGEVLMFYAYHANVYAYAADELLYSLELQKASSYFPVVSGDSWNCFHIPQRYEGAEIKIIIETKYASYLEYVPDFYFGDRLNIVRMEFERSFVSILLCSLIFAVGIIIMVYSVLIAKNNYNMLYLSAFALLMSFWFLINTPVFNMVLDWASISTNLSYLILGTVTVPFILFEKKLIDRRYGRACNCLCILAVCVQAVCVLLQLFGIRDLKETLLCTHIVFAVSIVGLIVLLVLNLAKLGFKNFSVMNRINILFGLVTAAGVAVDMVHYYVDTTSGKNYEFTKLAFLVYIIALCFFSIRETEQMIKKGKEAQRYEKMAYMDELTGIYNRMACNKDMQELDLQKDTYMVFMFDLNNLKKCNDTMGHNCGDTYITNCAHYIQEAFRNVGRCYRIGGDEFCVIGKAVSEQVIEECYRELEEKVAVHNVRKPLVEMSIACGHTSFDSSLDEDLKDTRARADKLMYKHKVEMKSQAGVM